MKCRLVSSLLAAACFVAAAGPIVGAERPASDSEASWSKPGLQIEEIDWESSQSVKHDSTAEAESHKEDASSIKLHVREATVDADDVDVAESMQSVRVPLFKMKDWPEFKVETEQICRRIAGRKICVNVPRAYQKTCELTAFAEIRHPRAESIRGKIETCTRQAVAAGVLAGVYTGSLDAAAAALKVYLTACLAHQSVDALSQLSVTVRTESKCGPWKPR